MAVKSVHSKNHAGLSIKSSGGRPKLMLDAVEARALRLASERARKARTPEAKAEAERQADALRKLAEVRRDLAKQARQAEQAADAPAWRPAPTSAQRANELRAYRRIWRADRALAERIAQRRTKITATGDYARALNGTLRTPKWVLTWRVRGRDGHC